MGYHTDFWGSIKIEPPLAPETIEFLTKFSQSRRMNRTQGPDYVDGTDMWGPEQDPGVIDYNTPPPGQPGLWCNWAPLQDGTEIEWDGGEKFYEPVAWMDYIITRYIAPKGHVCNGMIDAQGDEMDDRWQLHVVDNVVTMKQAVITFV